jgi:hypothetical protein
MEDVIKIDLKVFENLNKMLKSSDIEDQEIALETIKNIKPSDIMIALFIKTSAFNSRMKFELLKANKWSHTDLTLKQLYYNICNTDDPNIENLKEIYESIVFKHFENITGSYNFIKAKYTIEW